MRQAIVGKDYSNQTITGLFEGYFESCTFTNTLFKDATINAVFKNCSANPITLQNTQIKKLHTPGTDNIRVIIDKPTFQPIHLAKVLIWKKHNHQSITKVIRDYANANLKGARKNTVLAACDYINAHPELSWADFLFNTKTPKAVWDLAEQYFANDPDILEQALEIRSIRWPS